MPNKHRRRFRTLSAPAYRGSIPRCKGPKLDEFPHRGVAVEFRTLLSDPDSEGQAHVFEVGIGPRNYALKVFKFYDAAEDQAGLLRFQREAVSLDKFHAHNDPFYKECRAYGKLKEAGLDGKIAVRCYGYITLPPKTESELEDRFDVASWDRNDYDKPIGKRTPFRAIVKEMIRSDPPLTHGIVKKMLKDLKQIRKLKIYPLDIYRRNYKGGLLVDFSNAITEPHFLLEINSDQKVEEYENTDLVQFDMMVASEKVRTWVRATPNKETFKKLRPRDYLQDQYGRSTPSTDQ